MNTKRIIDPLALWGVEMNREEMWEIIESAYATREKLRECEERLLFIERGEI